MDINNYKFYVRDIGIIDADLTNVLNDVISDIAINTKIFKRVFGFTLEPNINQYNIKHLYQLSDKLQIVINGINYTDYTNVNDLLQTFKNKGNIGAGDIKVDETLDTSIKNTYCDYLECVDIFDNSFNSYMNYFEPINKDEFWLTFTPKESIEVTGIVSVNPLVNEITNNIENQIRFAIISGLKAYVHTLENHPNAQEGLVLNKQFEYDKQKLMNQSPNYGLIKTDIKNKNFKGL